MKSALVFLASLGLALAACPNIIDKAGWGGRPPAGPPDPMANPVPWTVVHHSASPSCYDQADCTYWVQVTQTQHMDINGWNDIGYSFMVGEDGNVYEGRGWSTHGAHAPGYNGISIGICVLGNFVDGVPNAAAQTAVQLLIECGVENGYISPDYGLVGHRQVTATECPGQSFYEVIQTWPHYVANP